MNDNKLILVTTAVHPRFRPSYLKNNVKEQLKFNVKNSISLEAYQKCESPMLPPDKPKLRPSVNFDLNNFTTYLLFFVPDVK